MQYSTSNITCLWGSDLVHIALKGVWFLHQLECGWEIYRKCLICRNFKKGMSLLGCQEERVWKGISLPLSKKVSALSESAACVLLVSEFLIPGRKSGFRSIGVRGSGDDAIFNLLHIVRKICKVGPIRGWALLSSGVPGGLIHGRWWIGSRENASSSLIHALVLVCRCQLFWPDGTTNSIYACQGGL